MPAAPVGRQRGRQKIYSDRLILKALMVMIIRRLYTAWALLAFLQQPDPVACQLRVLLCEQGRFPSRRTGERRLQRLPANLPNLIGAFGRYLVAVLEPWAQQGRGVGGERHPQYWREYRRTHPEYTAHNRARQRHRNRRQREPSRGLAAIAKMDPSVPPTVVRSGTYRLIPVAGPGVAKMGTGQICFTHRSAMNQAEYESKQHLRTL
jgi:hypothetical protein